MGCTAYLHTYFAIECPRSTFFTPTGALKRVCSVHVTGHTVGSESKFCDQCGAKTALQALEEPTEVFKAFCAERGATPEFAFQELRDDGWEWSDQGEAPTKYTIGWHKVVGVMIAGLQAGTSSETEITGSVMGLGIQLANVCAEDYQKASQVAAYSAEDLVRLAEPLREIANTFKLQGTPKLYCQVYFSC
jgi:hypothetical protein